MVIAHGSKEEITQARSIIGYTSPESLAEHEVPIETTPPVLEPTA